ncbi:hypothetical protein HK099_005644 [Clydaea vesicula]|uniref:Kynureninase n=1 Tax=Clydaea vesicula TaxID=447962 RepID=A0AAD5XYM2_9FUNG|nr:hypothetical protein HK099_005644 [Clydaea vesicula]KAJ3390955.1 hypothetical protein HDU92_000207 [Lobulomyces angularis]
MDSDIKLNPFEVALSNLSISSDFDSKDFAQILDDKHPSLKEEFNLPKINKVTFKRHLPVANGDSNAVYFCGNSLGLQPKITKKLINEELEVWAESGVNGHFDHPHERPWALIDDHVIEESAKIVGAKASEVAILNSLTSNLHFAMISFYRPTPMKYKILMESKAFPSDYFAFQSQVKYHGFDPKDAIIQLEPRKGEYTLRTEDIIKKIKEEGNQIALVLFSGVQYYTGQCFNMKEITKAGHEMNCVVGFDLAHAVGNVVLKLHDWDVDFACWCTYKYLNSGPGNIGGLFIHGKHANSQIPRLSGWWGAKPENKFDMALNFDPVFGANAYRLSNPCVIAVVALLGSLSVFKKTTMLELRQRSILLTGYLEKLLLNIDSNQNKFRIITPKNHMERGCQLSLQFSSSEEMIKIFEGLNIEGIVVDERKPDVIRVSPAPLYNTFADCFKFAEVLKKLLQTV